MVGGGGADVGEGVEVGVGVVAGAGDGAEKEPLAFSKGDECHWPSKSGPCLFRKAVAFVPSMAQGAMGEVCCPCAS